MCGMRALIMAVSASFVASFSFFALPLLASKHTAKTPVSPPRASEAHHPTGWQFTLPNGDPARGRTVFEKFECYYCHEVRGETFSYPVENAPELSEMASMHPVEFFAESIVNPNAVVPKTYRQADGTSPMTNFAEKMTVQEMIDVSAYVASLKLTSTRKTVSARGQVIAVVPEKSEIVISHGEIKGVMGAMTMGYKVSSASLLKSVKEGDTVEFVLDTQGRVITKITKAQSR